MGSARPMRCTASTTIHTEMALTAPAFSAAASTSVRRYPKVARDDAARRPTSIAASATTNPAESESMWAASASSASDPDTMPAISSARNTTDVSVSTPTRAERD
jgi:hypothetical protein